jgi:type II secretory pathway predicted ATPase ExeA
MGETCIVTHEVLTLDFRYPGPWVPMSAIFNFFGLRENPFKINPDPRFLYTTQQTQATSADLVYAIQSRKGLILLTGEVGTGKTMLIRRLLDWLTEKTCPRRSFSIRTSSPNTCSISYLMILECHAPRR